MAEREPITSPANSLVKRARKLRLRKHREREGAFLIEGIHPVMQALDHRAEIETILLAPDLLTSAAAHEAVEKSTVPVARLAAAAFATLTDREHPSGLAAIARIRERSLDELGAASDAIYVGLDEVGAPGNLGSIIRTADGAGAGAVILSGDTTDPWHPAAVKASMGTLFAVPVVRAHRLTDVIAWCDREGVTVVATSANQGSPHYGLVPPRPCLLLLGSEATGLPEDVIARSDIVARIPMRGSATSLNLAVAAGVLLYEITEP